MKDVIEYIVIYLAIILSFVILHTVYTSIRKLLHTTIVAICRCVYRLGNTHGTKS